MSALALKLIAEFAMFGDHFCAAMFDTLALPWNRDIYWVIRSAARIAFPIFGFQLSEGLRYTSNKWKYLLRLCIFAVVSEPFFNRALFGSWQDRYHQSVYVTLILGFFVMLLIQKGGEKKGAARILIWVSVPLVSFVLAFLAEMVFFTDYGGAGVFMLTIFGINTLPFPEIRKDPRKEFFLRTGIFLLAALVLFLCTNSSEAYALFGVIPVAFYSGIHGKMSKKMRIFFYAFYPLHLAVLSVCVAVLSAV